MISECHVSLCQYDSAIEAASDYLKIAKIDLIDIEVQRAITTLAASFLEAAVSQNTTEQKREEYAKHARKHLKESLNGEFSNQ